MIFLKAYTRVIYTPNLIFFIVIYLCCIGCEGEIDYDDELGVQESGERSRTEIVRLDGSSAINETRRPERIDSVKNDPMGEKTPKSVEYSPKENFESDYDYGKAIIYDPSGRFTVQVAGYKDIAKAKDLLRDLLNEGYPAYITKRDGNGEARVRIGYFSSFEDASNFGLLLRADRNIEFWIDRRENE
tara:strand:- start:3289 stop:3849 length:561 start_codon:yes stop_codon:yes gene_type:complete